MRSVVSEDTNVGLLLFDEPSASLDPVAEHGESYPPALGIVASANGESDHPMYRPVQPTTRTAREQDDAVLVAQIRESDPSCRLDLVSRITQFELL